MTRVESNVSTDKLTLQRKVDKIRRGKMENITVDRVDSHLSGAQRPVESQAGGGVGFDRFLRIQLSNQSQVVGANKVTRRNLSRGDARVNADSGAGTPVVVDKKKPGGGSRNHNLGHQTF